MAFAVVWKHDSAELPVTGVVEVGVSRQQQQMGTGVPPPNLILFVSRIQWYFSSPLSAVQQETH